MSTKHELIEMSRKLEAIVSNDKKEKSTQVLEILNLLKVLKVDPYLIRNAKIILTINNLRKRMTDEEVVKTSKDLLMSWKRSVIIENNALKNYMTNGSNGSRVRHEKNAQTVRRIKAKHKMDSILRYGIRDETRLKSRELLLKSLLPNNEELKDDIFRVVKLAVEIEKHIYEEFKNTDNKYKTRVRSRIANLSDEQNASLRYRVLKGTVTVKEIATMSAEDMASDRMKQMRQQFHDEAIAANLLPEVFGTTCDLLKCPKCKSNTCTYSQVQIERADEPMTTLCLCITCGYRWRYD